MYTVRHPFQYPRDPLAIKHCQAFRLYSAYCSTVLPLMFKGHPKTETDQTHTCCLLTDLELGAQNQRPIKYDVDAYIVLLLRTIPKIKNPSTPGS